MIVMHRAVVGNEVKGGFVRFNLLPSISPIKPFNSTNAILSMRTMALVFIIVELMPVVACEGLDYDHKYVTTLVMIQAAIAQQYIKREQSFH